MPRQALPNEVPRSARSLKTLATRLGWDFTEAFARGYPINKLGQLSEVEIDSLVIKLRSPVVDNVQMRAVVYWEDNSVFSAWCNEGNGWQQTNLAKLRGVMQDLDKKRSLL